MKIEIIPGLFQRRAKIETTFFQEFYKTMIKFFFDTSLSFCFIRKLERTLFVALPRLNFLIFNYVLKSHYEEFGNTI